MPRSDTSPCSDGREVFDLKAYSIFPKFPRALLAFSVIALATSALGIFGALQAPSFVDAVGLGTISAFFVWVATRNFMIYKRLSALAQRVELDACQVHLYGRNWSVSWPVSEVESRILERRDCGLQTVLTERDRIAELRHAGDSILIVGSRASISAVAERMAKPSGSPP